VKAQDLRVARCAANGGRKAHGMVEELAANVGRRRVWKEEQVYGRK